MLNLYVSVCYLCLFVFLFFFLHDCQSVSEYRYRVSQFHPTKHHTIPNSMWIVTFYNAHTRIYIPLFVYMHIYVCVQVTGTEHSISVTEKAVPPLLYTTIISVLTNNKRNSISSTKNNNKNTNRLPLSHRHNHALFGMTFSQNRYRGLWNTK